MNGKIGTPAQQLSQLTKPPAAQIGNIYFLKLGKKSQLTNYQTILIKPAVIYGDDGPRGHHPTVVNTSEKLWCQVWIKTGI